MSESSCTFFRVSHPCVLPKFRHLPRSACCTGLTPAVPLLGLSRLPRPPQCSLHPCVRSTLPGSLHIALPMSIFIEDARGVGLAPRSYERLFAAGGEAQLVLIPPGLLSDCLAPRRHLPTESERDDERQSPAPVTISEEPPRGVIKGRGCPRPRPSCISLNRLPPGNRRALFSTGV